MANGISLPVVVLDPGHGGTTKIGGSSPNNATGPNGLLEKDLTLEVAQLVGAALAGRATVVYTRTTDVNLSLADRAKVARDNNAAIFVAIHFNGFNDPAVDGTETWVARNPSADSRSLAQAILGRVVDLLGVRNRGMKESDFGVLLANRHLPTTAVTLVEIAFLSNPTQARKLEDPAYRQQIATAIANGILDQLSLSSRVLALGADEGAPPLRLGPESTIDFDVPGLVAPLAQPSRLTCWATVSAMMVGWRDQMSYDIATVMEMAGPVYLQKFRNNQGLLGSEKDALLTALGLQAEPPQDFSVTGLLNLLQTWGPIWVTTDENPSAAFAIHARIVTGMVGDGTPGGTLLRVVDPAGGRRYQESFQAFSDKFDEVARGDMADGGSFRPQVVHFQTTLADRARAQNQAQAASLSRWSSALDVTLGWGVPGGKILDPFYRSAEDKQQRLGKSGGRAKHLGVDISAPAGQGADGSANDPRRGLPVYLTIRQTIDLATLNAAPVMARGGQDDVPRDGVGLAGSGQATFRDAVVDVQRWSAPNDPDSYGGVLGLACHYDYTAANGSPAVFTLYVEYLHLITPTFLPKNRAGKKISAEAWAATGKGSDFGPRMQQGARLLPADVFSGAPLLVGYLGATETPHVHVQVGFANGEGGYVYRPRVDPTVVLVDSMAMTQGLAFAAAATDAMSPEELGDAESADDQLLQGQPAAQSLALYRRRVARALSVPALGAADAHWADDAQSPDYRHLGEGGRSQAFTFDASVIERLCQLNRFDLDGGQADAVLFGLRGCRLVQGTSWGPVMSAELSEDMPDHQDFHCVMGVWNRLTGQLALFRASTVPNWKLMEGYRQGGEKANLLPTGRYLYQVGTHRANKPSRIPGAFIQQGPVVVLRTTDDLVYTVRDTWDSGHVGDNLHPARLDGGAAPPFFSSAGCQTIAGNFGGDGHTGIWAEFRAAAGLSRESPASENGRQFVYVLLTGREARLAAAQADAASLTRLRFGASGTDVQALQQGLATAGYYSGSINGVMDVDTTMAFIRWQQAQDGGAADAIVTPTAGRTLGFDMLAAMSVTQGWGWR